MKPVLVVGGTGLYGRHIVAALQQQQTPVRVLSRRAAAARARLGDDVAVVEGDLREADTRQRMLDGVHAVVLAVSAMTWQLARQRLAIERDAVLATLQQAAASGVSRVIYLSGYDVRPDFVAALGLQAFSAPMLEVQDALAASTLDWTVLGCAPATEIFFSMIRGDRMLVPGGGPPTLPTVSPHDLGTIAARAALRDDLGRQHFRICGPEAMGFAEAARRIGAVWGRSIRFQPIPRAGIWLGAQLTRPFNPFLHQLFAAVQLMNRFPQAIAAELPRDHARLVATFGHSPRTLEQDAQEKRPVENRR